MLRQITEELANLQISDISEKIKRLSGNIEKVIKGKPGAVRIALVALFAGGHLLVEDVPGVGKTTLAQALAKSTDLEFKRIQFTSDLLPTDILGVSVLDMKAGDFNFKQGPIFANVILADEINRSTPKTQSALLEAMNESAVTVDGVSYELPKPFMVIATQNPFEYKGTFPLPENQLDRFSIRISVGYPDHNSEREILSRPNSDMIWDEIQPVISRDEVLFVQNMVNRVKIDEAILDYMLSIVNETRNSNLFDLGVSPRGAISLKRATQSNALINGRDYCIPDDVKEMAVPVLSHRVILKDGFSHGKVGEEEALSEALRQVKVPI